MTTHHAIKPDELRQLPAFHHLPTSQLEHLATMMVRKTFTAGQIIFMEGERAKSLWFVAEGRVKIIKQSEGGRVHGLCLMNSGKCFGSCPLFDMPKYPATAQALDAVTLFILPMNILDQAKQKDPLLVKTLLHIYSQRLEHLSSVSEMLGAWTVGDRINDTLLLYATPRDDDALEVALTHEKLASLAGTVREVVTRHLTQLEKDGIIQTQTGHIILLRPTELSSDCVCDEITT